MTRSTIQIQGLADIKQIVHFRRRWELEQRIEVLEDARVKLAAMRQRQTITVAEYRTVHASLIKGLAEARAAWDLKLKAQTPDTPKSTPPGNSTVLPPSSTHFSTMTAARTKEAH